jgi:nuclear pore complex protein Nup155
MALMDRYSFPRVQAEGDAKVAWDQEDLSLHGLTVLLKQSIEAIAFVILLSDYNISEIAARYVHAVYGADARTDPTVRNTLPTLTFADLFTSMRGRDVAKTLVTTMIEMQIGRELGVSRASELY